MQNYITHKDRVTLKHFAVEFRLKRYLEVLTCINYLVFFFFLESHKMSIRKVLEITIISQFLDIT